MHPRERELLKSGAAELGVLLGEEELDRFERFYSMLHEANQFLNLTRIPPEQTVALHFLDALTICRAVEFGRFQSLADVGSGAGVPGIPLKIAFPHLEVALIEATQKKARFLQEAVRRLDLSGVRVMGVRAEDLRRDASAAGRFDVAAARAVARLSKLLGWMLPLVRPGGLVVAYKSRSADEELAEAVPLLPRLGAALARDVPLSIPGTDVFRRILVFEKIGHVGRR